LISEVHNPNPVSRELDYEKLKRSLAFLVERYVPTELLTAEAHPIYVLERMEKQRVAMARRGLIVAIADMLEATQDLSTSQVTESDEAMEKLDAYTLSFLRRRFARRRSRGSGD
jgi:hypothetical protein